LCSVIEAVQKDLLHEKRRQLDEELAGRKEVIP
jgi:hypothetical protein